MNICPHEWLFKNPWARFIHVSTFSILDTYVAKPSPTLGNPRRQALKWAKERIDQSVKAYVVRVKPAVRPVFRVVIH